MSSVREVRLWPLAAQQPGLSSGLPDSVAACAVAPAGPAWPEHRRRFALEVKAEEASGWSGPISEPVALLVAGELGPGLLGHEVAQHRALADRPALGRHHHGVHIVQATSAVEMACWDLASRLAGEPVTTMLGGPRRPGVPVYASALGLDPTHPAAAQAADWMTSSGYWGQKWPLTQSLIDSGLAATAAALTRIREAAGTRTRFMIDGLRRCRLDQAKRLLPVLAELDLDFVEDLVHEKTDMSGLRSAADHASVVLASGENVVHPHDQQRLLHSGLIDVFQLEPAWCGGLSPSLHAIDTASALGIATFPHGDRVAAALALASVCTAPAVPAIEWHLTLEPLRQQVLREPLQPTEGTLRTRTQPGLSALPTLSPSAEPWTVNTR